MTPADIHAGSSALQNIASGNQLVANAHNTGIQAWQHINNLGDTFMKWADRQAQMKQAEKDNEYRDKMLATQKEQGERDYELKKRQVKNEETFNRARIANMNEQTRQNKAVNDYLLNVDKPKPQPQSVVNRDGNASSGEQIPETLTTSGPTPATSTENKQVGSNIAAIVPKSKLRDEK